MHSTTENNVLPCVICNHHNFTVLPFYYTWNNKNFDLLKCNHCNLITVNPLPTDEELQLLYSQDYFDHGAHGLDAYQKTYEELRDAIPLSEWQSKIADTILKAKPDAQSLFEIGAAMGYTLNAARSLGMQVSGLEISDSANKRAKQKFNLELYNGDFETLDLTNEYGKWDVVYGGDVFEHFSHPSVAVDKMYQMLKPSGIVYLVIPSTFNLFSTAIATAILKITAKRQKMADNPYHLFEYTTKTATRMMQTRFKDVQIINHIKKPSELNLKTKSLAYHIKYLLHLFNYPYTRLAGTHGDRLTIIAKK